MYQGIQHKKENPVEKIELEMKKHEKTELNKIKMPPKPSITLHSLN